MLDKSGDLVKENIEEEKTRIKTVTVSSLMNTVKQILKTVMTQTIQIIKGKEGVKKDYLLQKRKYQKTMIVTKKLKLRMK